MTLATAVRMVCLGLSRGCCSQGRARVNEDYELSWRLFMQRRWDGVYRILEVLATVSPVEDLGAEV